MLNRFEYLIKSLNSTAVFKKEYLICLFTNFTKTKELHFGNYNYRLLRTDKGEYGYWLDGVIIPISGITNQQQPLFTPQDIIELKRGDLVNVTGTINTTVGITLINAAVLCVAFGSKVPFINSYKISPKEIEDIVESKFENDITHDPILMRKYLVDDNPHRDSPNIHIDLPGEDPSKIYVREYLVCSKMMGQLICLENIIVPGLTAKSLTHHPDRDKVLKEVISQFKGKPIGPAEAAIIDKAMLDLDEKWLSDDPSRHLYTEGKAKNSRKRMYYTYGYVEAFTSEQKGTFSEKSLSDGIDFTKLPELINSSYSGSISRGLETQYTGANKKVSDRIFQNASVIMDDCGTKLGVLSTITPGIFKTVVDMYYIKPDGTNELIKSGDLDKLNGKVITIRSPIYCNSPRLTKCSKCVGTRISMNPKGINIAASDIDSAFMVAKLKKMHSNTSSSTQYDYTTSIE